MLPLTEGVMLSTNSLDVAAERSEHHAKGGSGLLQGEQAAKEGRDDVVAEDNGEDNGEDHRRSSVLG